MAMLPNDSHPGAGCSCAECLQKFPEQSSHTRMWQPIDTAPHDGTVILLAKGKKVYAGCFMQRGDSFPWLVFDPDNNSRDDTNAFQNNKFGPSHWQPMPDALSDEQQLTGEKS